MADTRRTVSAIQTLLANNTSGDISAQDVRDFLVSTSPAYGALYITSSAATTIGGTSTPTKAAGTTASIVASSDVTVATSNRITYTAAPTVSVLVLLAASMTTAGTNDVLELSIAKNGTAIAHSKIQRFVSTGTDVGAASTFAFTSLAQNDYVEIFVANNTDVANITLTSAVFGIQSIFV